MINPELEKAIETVNLYKKFNQSTVEKSEKVDNKTWILRKVVTDPNAVKFNELQSANKAAEKAEKRLKGRTRATPKVKKVVLPPPPKEPKPAKPKKVRPKTGTTRERLAKRTKIYELWNQGLSKAEISKIVGYTVRTVGAELSAYRIANGIKPVRRPHPVRVKMIEMAENGARICEVMAATGLTRNSIYSYMGNVRRTTHPLLRLKRSKSTTLPYGLSKNNLTVKRLFESGMTREEICEYINIKPRTLVNHLNTISEAVGGDWANISKHVTWKPSQK